MLRFRVAYRIEGSSNELLRNLPLATNFPIFVSIYLKTENPNGPNLPVPPDCWADAGVG